MTYRLCALIPTYNHHKMLPEIVKLLDQSGLPVFVVDDGSGPETQDTLSNIDNAEKLRLPINSGKGAALEAGLTWVSDLGYTHAFQIDADGQHALDNLGKFLTLSRKYPHALISGKPHYDSSVPTGRRIGRWFTHIWVWIETLSFRISDSMCGFRIYPIDPTLEVIKKVKIGRRMDFDTEVMVRMYWNGTPVLFYPVKVSYPEGNHSNFDTLRDNWRITKMHTRLVFTMLVKLPSVLFRRPDYTNIEGNWSNIAERGSILGVMALATCYRLLGRTLCTTIGAPVVLYFYFTGSTQRRASKEFLTRVFKVQSLSNSPTFIDGLRHYMSFFQMLLDKFAAWSGHLGVDSIEYDNPEQIYHVMCGPRGGVLLVSHLGCMEFCRALINNDQKKRMHILLHSKNAQRFNRLISYVNPQPSLNIIEVTDIGSETIMFLKERVENGDWVVIAADRTPVSENPRVVRVPFLGSEASFAQGPYILASLLQCPVYTAMAVRESSKYKVHIELFAKEIKLLRGSKEECIRGYAQQYSKYLESYCYKYPYQWYNFFNFWHDTKW